MLSNDFRADLFNWAYKWARWAEDFPESTFREYLHSHGFPVEEETERIFGHVLDRPNFWSEFPVGKSTGPHVRISAADLDRRDMLNVLPDAQNGALNAPVLKSDTSTRLDNLEAMGANIDDTLQAHDSEHEQHQGNIEDLQSDVEELWKRLNTLESRISSLESWTKPIGGIDIEQPVRATWDSVTKSFSDAISDAVNDSFNKRAGRKF